MSLRTRVLVVDDEPQITRVLRSALEAQEFEVKTATNAVSAIQVFQETQPELIVTDLAMPNGDGVSLCKSVRSLAATPLIVLSVRGDERTKVEALNAGADDYVTKPFGMDELLARIRALLRRVNSLSAVTGLIQDGDFEVEPSKRMVKLRGDIVHLTPKEYDMLLYLLAHSDRVLTHRAILTALWGPHSGGRTENLRVFIAQFRRKIERKPNAPEYLKTEPWIGYRFQTEP